MRGGLPNGQGLRVLPADPSHTITSQEPKAPLTDPSTADDYVREVPGVRVIGGRNPHCITIEASDLAAAELEHRFGSVLLSPLECYAFSAD